MKRKFKMLRWFLLNLLILMLTLSVMGRPAFAEDIILYCAEEHIVGMQLERSVWSPAYSDAEFGRRYAIRFSDDMTNLSGVHGTDAVYTCGKYFPTKAPDLITCVNPLVATMVFNFSTETKRFIFNLVAPGGWLGEGTSREEGKELFFDNMIMGQCQAF